MKNMVSKKYFFVLIFIIIAMSLFIAISNLRIQSIYHEGMYKGQIEILNKLHEYDIGNLNIRGDFAEFTIKNGSDPIFVFNRNDYPNEQKYPTGRKPSFGLIE